MAEKGAKNGGARSVDKNTGSWWCKQGFRRNLIDALKLLANQKEDGDGLIQNFVTNLGEESRKGLMEEVEKLQTS